MTITLSGINLNNNPNWGLISATFDNPARRGGNFYISHADKRLWLPKPVDQRTARLEMWVAGSTVGEYQSNLSYLQVLFHDPYESVIGKDGLTGHYQIADEIGVKIVSRNSCKLTVPIVMSNPYFYRTTAYQASLVGLGELEILNEGVEVDCIIDVVGDVTNPEFSSGGRILTYTGTISTVNNLHVDTAAYTATRGSANAISGISHTGGFKLFSLVHGLQTVVFDGTAGATAPTLTITYTEAFI